MMVYRSIALTSGMIRNFPIHIDTMGFLNKNPQFRPSE